MLPVGDTGVAPMFGDRFDGPAAAPQPFSDACRESPSCRYPRAFSINSQPAAT